MPSLVQLQEAYLRQGVSMGHWQAVGEDAAKASTGHPEGAVRAGGGGRVPPEGQRFDSVEPMANEVLYVRTPHGYLPLSPFIVVRDCVICRQREVFYADRVQQGRGDVLKSLERGHRFHDQTLVDEVAAVLPEQAQ